MLSFDKVETSDYEITMVRTSELRPYAKNSRKHGKDQIEKIAASIKRFGFTNPILVGSENTILAGHGRLAAAELAGLEEVPVISLAHLTEKEQKAYVIADNKLAEMSSWDQDILLEELSAIAKDDYGHDLNQLLNIDTFVKTRIEQVNVAELHPHPKNYKVHPESQLEHLRKSITEHGIYRNIIVTMDGTILAGHGVYEAAVSLGMNSLPCLRIEIDPFSTKAMKLLTADNEIAQLADANSRELTEILQQIFTQDDLLGTGYDSQKLEALLMVSRSKDELKNLDDEEWDGIVDFEGMKSALKCIVSFEDESDRADFFKALGVNHTDKTKNIWWPLKERKMVNHIVYEPEGF